ncbi:MAG: peptidoglycan DD-metalloendopeptidase family protein [Clostridia bacterium]
MKKNFKKILSVLLLASMLAGYIGIVNINDGSVAYAKTNAQLAQEQADLLNEQKKLNEKQKDYDEKLKILAQNKADVMDQKAVLDEQMTQTQKQITALDNIIADLNAKLEIQNVELEKSNKALDSYYKVYKDRIRDSYEKGQKSTMNAVLSSKSFIEYLSKLEVDSQIVEYDNQLMDSMTVEINKIKDLKEGIEKNKETNEGSKALLELQRNEQKSQIEKSNALMKAIEQDVDAYLAKEKAADEAESAINKQLAEIAAENERKRQEELANNPNGKPTFPSFDYNGEGFGWPTPGFKTITSPFGWRKDPFSGKLKFHKGVDISGGGIFNSPCHAAVGGVVIFASWDRWGGNMVSIDIGSNMITTYMHLNSSAVSVGQVVKKGDVIGKVGTTGNSTGPHLHFEVMAGGTVINPMQFFK